MKIGPFTQRQIANFGRIALQVLHMEKLFSVGKGTFEAARFGVLCACENKEGGQKKYEKKLHGSHLEKKIYENIG
nr:hypothetical protein [uncultured Celeribacter sp.]